MYRYGMRKVYIPHVHSPVMDGPKASIHKSIKQNCFKCKTRPQFTILFRKPYCKLCYAQFLNPVNKKRVHNWNNKVNLALTELKCLTCDFVLKSGISEENIPDCYDTSIPKYITPLVFIPGRVIAGIHPASYKEPTKRFVKSNKIKLEKKSKPVKIKENINESIPDFLK